VTKCWTPSPKVGRPRLFSAGMPFIMCGRAGIDFGPASRLTHIEGETISARACRNAVWTAESDDQAWPAPHSLQGFSSRLTQLRVILGTDVRQLMLLPVAPDVFDRIQFGRIGREVFRQDLPSEAIPGTLAPDGCGGPTSGPRPAAAACEYAGPAPQATTLWTLHRSRTEAKEETPERKPGHCRQGLQVEVVGEHPRLPPGHQGTAPVRALAQSAFVDEDDRPPFPRFLLMTGHPKGLPLASPTTYGLRNHFQLARHLETVQSLQAEVVGSLVPVRGIMTALPNVLPTNAYAIISGVAMSSASV